MTKHTAKATRIEEIVDKLCKTGTLALQRYAKVSGLDPV